MVVAFSGRFSLVINGTLLAIGENDDSIRVHRLPYHASDGHLGLRFRNTATVSRLNKVVFEDGFANSGNEERYGGALELYFAEVEIDSCSFFGNRARIDGGAIYSREAGTLTIRDCEFIGDSTRFGAGGAVLARTSGTVTIERCRFVDNKAITSGGSVVTESGVTPRISECYFADNFAFQRGGALWLRSVPAAGYVRGGVIESSTADQGGGIYLDNARGVIESCSIRTRTARVGGGIATGGAAIENCRFTNNTNPDGCGGAICSRTLMAVTLEECRFDENTAKHGGAVCISGGSGRIAKCEFAGNSAVAESDDQESLGGALHCTGGTIIDRCSFTRNQAEGGGAVYSECGIISNSSFDSCSAVIGGAILQRNSPAVFEQLEFRFNRASEGSGAVYISGAECSDFGSVYRGNSSFFGGAIGVDSGVYSGDSILCLDNSAEDGGGVLWIGGSGFAQLSNSELYRNHAEDGGVVCADGGGIDLEYCLLDSNYATRVGGGVYLAGSGMIARKCTFVNNTAPPLGGLIHARGNAFVTANSSLFAGNEDFVLVPSDETSLEFTFCLSDGSFGSAVDSMGMPQRVNFNGDSCDFGFNLIGEPEFVDFAARDYRLLENSLAVHAGDSMLPNDRDGTRSDIGLYPGERPYALPRPFNLTTPLQAQRIHTRDVVEFAWNESRDDDPGDRVTYQLRLVGESIDMTFDTQEERTLPMNIEAGEYTWWVVASSLRPDTSRESFEVRQLVVYDSIAAATESGLPMVFGVELNGPNPFNSTTQLRLALPRPARVVVEVHDVLGRQATHGEYEFSAGVHYVGIDGSHWGSGVYWATVTTAENRSRVKLLLVK